MHDLDTIIRRNLDAAGRALPHVCSCGCGGRTRRVVSLLHAQDRGTAEALHWAEASVAPLRMPVPLIDGHESDLVGFVLDEREVRQ